MMNSLPRRVRVYAALCHLAGLIWLAGFLAIMAPSWLQMLLYGITILSPCITWLSTRGIHDFVDRAGREAVNAQLSMLLYGACAVFITAMACGLNPNMHTATTWGVWAAIALLFLAPAATGIYTIMVIVAAVQALQGNVLRYPLIIRFIPNP